MGQLIAVEGLDGAGKNTLVTGLIDRWSAAGLRVATFTFPRYGRSATADIAAEARRIYIHAGLTDAMPPANVSWMEEDERALIRDWYRSVAG